MARNATESELRTSNMVAGCHFVKKNQKRIQLRIDLKWPEMRSKVIFEHPKWPPTMYYCKLKIAVFNIIYDIVCQ